MTGSRNLGKTSGSRCPSLEVPVADSCLLPRANLSSGRGALPGPSSTPGSSGPSSAVVPRVQDADGGTAGVAGRERGRSARIDPAQPSEHARGRLLNGRELVIRFIQERIISCTQPQGRWGRSQCPLPESPSRVSPEHVREMLGSRLAS